MSGEHRVLERVCGVVGIAAGDPREAVELAVVTVEQLLEGIAVPGDVCLQQLCVRPPWIDDPPEAPHTRTLINGGPGR